MTEPGAAIARLLLGSYPGRASRVQASTSGTFLDWIFGGGAVVLLGMLMVGWLASYRTPKGAAVGSGRWLKMPVWAQIGSGLAVFVLLAYVGYVLWIPLPLAVPDGVLGVSRGAGLALFLVGALLVVWARWTLGRMYGVSTSSVVQLNAQHRLVQRGPYACVRHPLYLGIWLTLLGTALAYRTWTPLVYLVVFWFLHRRARREEAVLHAAFGAEWRAYAARAPMYLPRWRRKTLTREDEMLSDQESSDTL